MEAARTLGELAKKATDPAKAAEYRNRADQLLSGLAARAQDDAQLSMTLGIAYLRAGDAAKAETYLRRAAEMNESDPEARLQYAKALSAQGKTADAIRRLEEAQKLAPERNDIALELAKTYEQANRPEQAIAAYEKLLALPDVAIIVRVKAGRYFAQHGMIEKAAAQAGPILAAEPENPGGLYLQAEGLIAAGKPEEAAPLLTRATDADPDAQYLDALGRALEARLVKSGDTKYIEGARFAYERAAKADPTLFHAWLGQGKMLVANKDWDAAIKVLLEANKLDKSDAATMYYTGVAYHGLRNSGEQYQKAAVQWLAAALKASKELGLAERAEAWFKLGELHRMLNKSGDAGRAVQAWENATRLGEELEKQGTSPTWLTETYYELGDLYSQLGSPAQQARAWHRYVDRKPKPGVRLTTAEQALATSLKQF
jgi:tetratricopeptide (TPR) repeat protein